MRKSSRRETPASSARRRLAKNRTEIKGPLARYSEKKSMADSLRDGKRLVDGLAKDPAIARSFNTIHTANVVAFLARNPRYAVAKLGPRAHPFFPLLNTPQLTEFSRKIASNPIDFVRKLAGSSPERSTRNSQIALFEFVRMANRNAEVRFLFKHSLGAKMDVLLQQLKEYGFDERVLRPLRRH